MAFDHCKRCYLTSDHPGVKIGADHICNFCKLDVPKELQSNLNIANANYQCFAESKPSQTAKYDCLFMYSGGKDSTYMLDKFVNVERRRVLSYTFKIPFESANAADNLENVRQKIDTEFYVDTADEKIKLLMRHVFNELQLNRAPRYLDEKLPCMICRSFFVIRAILFAYQRSIPFIIFCADPQQILTIDPDVRHNVVNFFETIGRNLTYELFGTEIDDILLSQPEYLPKIVFPLIPNHREYNPVKMVEELKEKGLYSTSPIETHCSLFPLLNYYSFSHYNCSFYKLNMSSQARKKHGETSTFSISFGDSGQILEIEERYKSVIFDIVEGASHVDVQRAQLREVFREMQFSDSEMDYLTHQFLSMNETARDLGIALR